MSTSRVGSRTVAPLFAIAFLAAPLAVSCSPAEEDAEPRARQDVASAPTSAPTATGSVPGTPANVQADANDDGLVVSWQAANDTIPVAGYHIRVNGGTTHEVHAKAREVTVYGLTTGTYQVEVISENESGPSAAGVAEVTIVNQPAAPSMAPRASPEETPEKAAPAIPEQPAPPAQPETVTPPESEPAKTRGPTAADREDVATFAGNIVEDVADVDEYFKDGIQVPLALNSPSGAFSRLKEAPAPPQVDEATWYALIGTSEQFTADAADFYYDSPGDATAKYLATRKHIQPDILKPINKWLGTSYSIN